MATVERRRSHCRICTVQCGIVVDLEDGRVARVRGDFDHPLTRGYTCPKGRALPGLHHHPDAILRPMLRSGDRLADSDWDTCLDDLAARLRRVIDEHGPQSVAMNFGSGLGMDAAGYRMAEAFHAALGRPPKFSPLTIDGTAKTLVAMLMGGFPGLNPKTDYDRAAMLIYVGTNPMVSHGHNTGMFNPAAAIRALADRGAVWTVDPLFTETARFSTGHIAPRPGTDHAVLGFLLREILSDGPLNPAQPVQDLEALKAAVAPFTRADAARLAGIEQTALADLLAAVRRHGRVVVETGTGVTMAASANITQWFAWALMIVTGAMNREGGAWFHPGFINRFETFELPVIDQPLHPAAPSHPDVSGLLGEWPCAALPAEIASGRIRALINFGGSIVRSFPQADLMADALAKLDVHATFEIVANETTALSTHVLPSRSQLERSDISLWDTLGFRVSLQYTPAIAPPLGERRAAWWIIAGLMRRLGLPVPDDVPADDRAPGADDAMLARLMPHARSRFAEVAEQRYVEHPLDFPARWVDDHVARIGGWRLAPPVLVEQLGHLLADDGTAEHGLRFTARRQRRKLNASLDFLGAPAEALIHPEDAAARGIGDGEGLAARTPQGEIRLAARLDPTIRRGVVSIPHGHAAANVNRLTDAAALDPLGGMALYTGIPIEIDATG